MNDKYYLTITNENGIISGHLSTIDFEDDKNCFNPLTVLGSLLSLAATTKETFKDTYRQHPFFNDKELCQNVDKHILRRNADGVVHPSDPFYYDYQMLNSFLVSFRRLNKCFKSQNNISLNEFELIKTINRYEFILEIGKGKKAYEKGSNKFRYRSVDFGPHYSSKKLQKFIYKSKNPVRFAYICFSLNEVLFAVWHYLIFHGYTKFNQCHHCGTYFATKSLKAKYCTDNSPYENYTHLECEQAVRNIKQKLSRRRKTVYNFLYINHEYSIDAFILKCDKFCDKIKERSSVKNLKKYEDFLYKQQTTKH